LEVKIDAIGRRKFTPQWKWHIVNQAKTAGRSASVIAREHDLNTNQLFRWIREAEKGHARWVRVAKGVTGSLEVDEPGQFLPVTVSPSIPATSLSLTSTIKLELASGHRLSVENADPDTLKMLLSVLA